MIYIITYVSIDVFGLNFGAESIFQHTQAVVTVVYDTCLPLCAGSKECKTP